MERKSLTLAHLRGWQAILEPAKATETYQDGVSGRSGGVAIIIWNGRRILNNIFDNKYQQGQSYYERQSIHHRQIRHIHHTVR
eukprot:571449-Heterocapsa_arctica.AAC.1